MLKVAHVALIIITLCVLSFVLGGAVAAVVYGQLPDGIPLNGFDILWTCSIVIPMIVVATIAGFGHLRRIL